jgi:hypothetical protein
MDGDTPTLTLASNNTKIEADVKKRREIEFAENGISNALANLGANLLRVAAGAGKSYSIPREAVELVEAVAAYIDLVGHGPPSEFLEQALRPETHSEWMRDHAEEEDRKRWYADGSFNLEWAKEDIQRGAIRMVASRILDQRTQEKTAESLMMEGVRKLEKARKEYNEYMTREWTPQSAYEEALAMLKGKRKKEPADHG